jgi:hypothetical protein
MRVDTRLGEKRFEGAENKAVLLRYPHAEIPPSCGDQHAAQLVIDTSRFNWGPHRSPIPHSVSVRLDRNDLDFLLVHLSVYQAKVIKLAGRDGVVLEVKIGAKNTSQDIAEETCVMFAISGVVLAPDFRVTDPDQRLAIALPHDKAEQLFEALVDLLNPVHKRTFTAERKRTPAQQRADEDAWGDYQFAA